MKTSVQLGRWSGSDKCSVREIIFYQTIPKVNLPSLCFLIETGKWSDDRN